MGHAVQRDAKALFAAGGHGVVETHALDEAAVATLARVGHNDVEERALLGAAAGKSDHDHVQIPSERFWGELPRETHRAAHRVDQQDKPASRGRRRRYARLIEKTLSPASAENRAL